VISVSEYECALQIERLA